tara:strand:- start:7080 stop:7421 length:342 start_codon:yes stop_codon:yes gene_type:complete
MTQIATNLKNGALRNLDLKQTNDLLQIIDGKVSKRRRYLKVALLAVLKYDRGVDGYLTAGEIAVRASKYTNKNHQMTSKIAGNLLGNMYRMGILSRTHGGPPYAYKIKEIYYE